MAVTHRCPWPLTPALPTCVLSLRGDAPSTHNASSHPLKTPVLHVFCLLEGKQSLTFQGRKGKATWDGGHSEHGLLSWQQCRAVGIITLQSEAGGRVEGPCPSWCYWSRAGWWRAPVGCDCPPRHSNFRTSAPGADQCLQERPNPSACRNHAEELLLLTLGAQGGFSTHFHTVLATCYLPSLFLGSARILPAYLNSHLFSHKIHFSPAALCCYDNRLALLLLSHPCFSCIRTLPLILQPCSKDMTSSFILFSAERTVCSIDCFPRSVFSA